MRAARRLALEHTLVEVVSALTARGVRSLVLKGPAFARWLYDNPSDRTCGDLDLLVAPDDVGTARSALAGLGFEPLPAGTHAHERTHDERWLRGGARPMAVELHHTLPLAGASPAALWARFSAGASTLETASGSVEAPGPAASALLVAMHAAWHDQAAARPQEDLARALRRVDPATWRAAASLARELDAEPAFVAGLGRVAGGRDLIGELGLGDVRLPRHLRLLGGTRPHTAAGIEAVLSTPGVLARANLVAVKLVPSTGFMRAAYPLARRGRRGLAASYLWRPLDLLLHLPSGLAGWLRAARES